MKESKGASHSEATVSGTVLIADDDEFIRKLSGRMLRILGFTPLVVEDGNKALAAFRDHEQGIVCTILDVSMPGMSGEETAVAIRNISSEASIIFCSGHGEQRVARIADKLGRVGFLRKPFDLQDLKQTLHRVLGETRAG